MTSCKLMFFHSFLKSKKIYCTMHATYVWLYLEMTCMFNVILFLKHKPTCSYSIHCSDRPNLLSIKRESQMKMNTVSTKLTTSQHNHGQDHLPDHPQLCSRKSPQIRWQPWWWTWWPMYWHLPVFTSSVHCEDTRALLLQAGQSLHQRIKRNLSRCWHHWMWYCCFSWMRGQTIHPTSQRWYSSGRAFHSASLQPW